MHTNRAQARARGTAVLKPHPSEGKREQMTRRPSKGQFACVAKGAPKGEERPAGGAREGTGAGEGGVPKACPSVLVVGRPSVGHHGALAHVHLPSRGHVAAEVLLLAVLVVGPLHRGGLGMGGRHLRVQMRPMHSPSGPGRWLIVVVPVLPIHAHVRGQQGAPLDVRGLAGGDQLVVLRLQRVADLGPSRPSVHHRGHGRLPRGPSLGVLVPLLSSGSQHPQLLQHKEPHEAVNEGPSNDACPSHKLDPELLQSSPHHPSVTSFRKSMAILKVPFRGK
mmetsp:Transcript_71574/g.119904  ORF Transcript_71574/g.119904 Transcript_71574/m.119904 type:complete len:278 (-) Transcript_71574:1239-2072(-)